MQLFHLYQTVYSFRGIVFTDSLAVEDFAKKINDEVAEMTKNY